MNSFNIVMYGRKWIELLYISQRWPLTLIIQFCNKTVFINFNNSIYTCRTSTINNIKDTK
jgi:hypothetical protein